MKPDQFQVLLTASIGPVVTLITIAFGVFFQNRHIDARMADVNARLGDLKDVLRAEMRAQHSELLAKFAELDGRLSRIEGERRIIQ